MPLTYIVRGQEVTENHLLVSAPKVKPKSVTAPKRTHDRDGATMSMGFVVLGYPSNFMDSVNAEYAARIKAAERQEKGSKHPGAPAEFLAAWKTKNKPKRIGRPYSLEASANACAELARRTGWQDVRVEELLRA